MAGGDPVKMVISGNLRPSHTWDWVTPGDCHRFQVFVLR